ncbi:MAG: c-type cytochrome [Verrucomicrobiota bacterium]|nr:c-type cytochrome [Verrucomicrobiota bacterium]
MKNHLVYLLLIFTSLARADETRDELIVQTVLKLESFNYDESSDKVKASINRYLNRNLGKGEYFTLVEKFSIKDQLENLTSLSTGDKGNPEAIGLLVKLGGEIAISKTLEVEGESRIKFIKALGTVNSPIAVKALSEVIQNKIDVDANIAATALTKTALGQLEIIELIGDNKIPSKLVKNILPELVSSADPEVRKMALKLNVNDNGKISLKKYNIKSLITKRGSVKKGKQVYMKACFTCHKSGDIGIDFGPALTEIGDKLAREAMFVSIIDPNAAISFGYEGFNIKTKSGSTLVGYIISDSDDELVMKVPGGVSVTTKKSEIFSKNKIDGSLMPEGIIASITEEELVDLVEYLMTLKKG